MRTLAIGDIHGCLTALETLLDAVQPDPEDLTILLGDYVDRGPDSRGVVDRVLELTVSHRVVPLLGNHEEFMLEAGRSVSRFRHWLSFGGDATLASYGLPKRIDSLQHIPPAHWRFLREECCDYHETDTHFFTHAAAEPRTPLDLQAPWGLRWARFINPAPHVSGKVMICGHTSQKSGEPRNLGHAICIDTRVYGEGWLSCLEVETGRLWQTNQHGELRTASIETFREGPAGGPPTEPRQDA